MRKDLLRARPLVEPPRGFLSGRRTVLRRSIAQMAAWVNRGLDMLPPGRWMHRMVRRGMQWTESDFQLRRGGPGLDGMRIAFLSDVHAGSYLDEADLIRIFSDLGEQEPDLVCLGGDLINSRMEELRFFEKGLARIDPPLGVFAVPGNHDHFWGADLDTWCRRLEGMGVRLLINEGTRLLHGGDGLWIAGVDDLVEGKPDLAAALEGARDDEPMIVLSHNPDFFFEAAAVEVDLTLSGHTHGGQVRFGSWAPVNHSRFGWLEGWHEIDESSLYVGRGVGVTLLPLRFGAPAEIPMLRLQAPR